MLCATVDLPISVLSVVATARETDGVDVDVVVDGGDACDEDGGGRGGGGGGGGLGMSTEWADG